MFNADLHIYYAIKLKAKLTQNQLLKHTTDKH
jgi:hypothetical protein